MCSYSHRLCSFQRSILYHFILYKSVYIWNMLGHTNVSSTIGKHNCSIWWTRDIKPGESTHLDRLYAWICISWGIAVGGVLYLCSPGSHPRKSVWRERSDIWDGRWEPHQAAHQPSCSPPWCPGRYAPWTPPPPEVSISAHDIIHTWAGSLKQNWTRLFLADVLGESNIQGRQHWFSLDTILQLYNR